MYDLPLHILPCAHITIAISEPIQISRGKVIAMLMFLIPFHKIVVDLPFSNMTVAAARADDHAGLIVIHHVCWFIEYVVLGVGWAVLTVGRALLAVNAKDVEIWLAPESKMVRMVLAQVL